MKALTRDPVLSRFQVHRDLAVLVILVIGCALPFLSQPYHMDDNFYMDMARNVQANPLFPYDVPYDFGGLHLQDMASHTHPPFQAYFLAVIQRCAGEGTGREWIYHSGALVFPILAVVALYFIAARFVERPLWPSAAMAVCPLNLVMGHTLMTDVPTLAFWLCGIACFLWATELQRRRLYAASSLCQFAAMFTSYQAVSLFPLLGFYHWRKRGRAFGWAALCLPLAGMVAWLVMSSLHYHRLVLLDTAGYVQSRGAVALGMLGTKLLALMEYQGWLIVFPLFLLYIFARGLSGRLFMLALLGSIYLAQTVVPAYRPVDKVIFVVGLVTGFFMTTRMGILCADAFRAAKAERSGFGRIEAQFLALWYFGVAAYCLVLFTEGSARYILPLVPPALLVFFRRLEVAEITEYRAESYPFMNSAMVASGAIVLSLAWGMFLAQADFEFARVYPRAAAAFARMYPGFNSYVTGEWGFRYYFGRIGARPLPADESSVPGGSLLIRPRLALPYDPPADLLTMTLPCATLHFDLKTPFRTMDHLTPAGFYSTGWGLIPFSLSQQGLETLEIRQVDFMVARLPWARIEGAAEVKPWPGYVYLPDRALAVLAKSGTRIVYPWDMRIPAMLRVTIGSVNAVAALADTDCEFEILRRNARGEILSRFFRSLHPETRREDRGWHEADLLLPARVADGETLEIRYLAQGRADAMGAFAGASLAAAATQGGARKP
jgi:hypothetical protein